MLYQKELCYITDALNQLIENIDAAEMQPSKAKGHIIGALDQCGVIASTAREMVESLAALAAELE
uniref:Uncharacterized protein n=1 Tax=viral metagenome TaxID=1070528 RepID=A0A6M3JZB1_9ZZZZ